MKAEQQQRRKGVLSWCSCFGGQDRPQVSAASAPAPGPPLPASHATRHASSPQVADAALSSTQSEPLSTTSIGFHSATDQTEYADSDFLSCTSRQSSLSWAPRDRASPASTAHHIHTHRPSPTASQRTSLEGHTAGHHPVNAAAPTAPYGNVAAPGVHPPADQLQGQVLAKVSDMYKNHGAVCQACQTLIKYAGQHEVALDPSQLDSDIGRLVSMTADIGDIMQHAPDDSGWAVVRDDILKLMYRHEAGSMVHSFKARCTLEAPIEHLLVLVREFDLVKTWNHYVKQSVVLKEWSAVELLGLATMWMPWPLHHMDVLVGAVGVDLLDEHGCFVVSFKYPKNIPADVQMPASHANHAKIRMQPGSFIQFTPLPPAQPGGPLRTRVCLTAHADAGIRNVPHFIITFVLKVLSPFIYNMAVRIMKKSFKDPANVMCQRLKMRPELYGVVAERARRHLARQDKADGAQQAQ